MSLFTSDPFADSETTENPTPPPPPPGTLQSSSNGTAAVKSSSSNSHPSIANNHSLGFTIPPPPPPNSTAPPHTHTMHAHTSSHVQMHENGHGRTAKPSDEFSQQQVIIHSPQSSPSRLYQPNLPASPPLHPSGLTVSPPTHAKQLSLSVLPTFHSEDPTLHPLKLQEAGSSLSSAESTSPDDSPRRSESFAASAASTTRAGPSSSNTGLEPIHSRDGSGADAAHGVSANATTPVPVAATVGIAAPTPTVITANAHSPSPGAPSPGAALLPSGAPPFGSLAEKIQDKRERIRCKAIEEIVQTEYTYSAALDLLLSHFIVPLMTAAATPEKVILSESDIQQLFSNIPAIAKLNQKFYEDLKNRVYSGSFNESSGISDLFLSFSHFFKMYSQYVSNHDTAHDHLKKLEAENKAFQAFLQAKFSDAKLKGQTSLASFLILPIQRIPRYKLLLDQVVAHTDASHPDYAPLRRALDLVSQVAIHINESIRTQENRASILRIQEQFVGRVDFVSPSRRFIKQGTLTKRCRKANKDYHFILFNDLLVYANWLGVKKLNLHKKIPVDALFNVESTVTEENNSLAFQIVNSVKSFVVYAPDADTKNAWVNAFGTAVNEAKTKTTPSEKNSVAPVWTSDKSSNECVLCKKPFTTFNRRHHCRRCGALCCSACSSNKLVLAAGGSAERVCSKCWDARGSISFANRNGTLTVPLDRGSIVGSLFSFSNAAVAASSAANHSPVSFSERLNASPISPGTPPALMSSANAANAAHSHSAEHHGTGSGASPSPVYIPSSPLDMQRSITPLGSAVPQGPRYRALYGYKAEDGTEALDLLPDDVLVVQSKDTSGWWRGYSLRLQRHGIFPHNYVAEDVGRPLPAVQDTNIKRVKAVKEYAARSGVEISLKVDEEIDVHKSDPAGVMLYGVNSQGQRGWFQKDATVVILEHNTAVNHTSIPSPSAAASVVAATHASESPVAVLPVKPPIPARPPRPTSGIAAFAAAHAAASGHSATPPPIPRFDAGSKIAKSARNLNAMLASGGAASPSSAGSLSPAAASGFNSMQPPPMTHAASEGAAHAAQTHNTPVPSATVTPVNTPAITPAVTPVHARSPSFSGGPAPPPFALTKLPSTSYIPPTPPPLPKK